MYDTTLFFESRPLESIFDALTEQGFCVLDDALPTDLVRDLKATALAREANQGLKLAGTGKEAKISDLRGDKIAWLEPQDESPAVQAYLALLDDLQLAMNRHLMMGLVDVEAHFALYEVGQAYHTHIDQLKASTLATTQRVSPNLAMKRSLSVIVYLNEGWQAQDGGELKLYLDEHAQCPTGDAKATLISPLAGRMVLFLSDRFWHEVLPAQQPRLSVTAWFRSRG